MKPMNVTKRLLNANDIKELEKAGKNGNAMVEDYYALEFDLDSHSTVDYFKKSIVDKVGLEYIKDHTTMNYSFKYERFVANIDFNDVYDDNTEDDENAADFYNQMRKHFFAGPNLSDLFNDVESYPPRTIKVEYFDTKQNGTVIYKALDDNGLLFMRTVYKSEPLAQWHVCSESYEPVIEPDPNISFDNNGAIETVAYDESKGAVVAYQDNFNPNFNSNNKI